MERSGLVAELITVEAPSTDLAHTLIRRLRELPAEIEQSAGRAEVTIPLVGNAERAVVEVLNTVDEWLVEHAIEQARVRLNGHVYTLTPPRKPRASGGRGDAAASEMTPAR